jgi:Ser/Thr protein kinase RdoA (MazF antagonist)
MASQVEFAPVLAAYPADCQPTRVEPLGSAGGFSGASFWQLSTARGLLCLRRWPRDYPPVDQLQFIQAVLWHVHHEGFDRVPLPLEAASHAGYVVHDGCFWELAPWMPGVADYHRAPSDTRLIAALAALAELHLAAASFPLPDIGPSVSPGMVRREAIFRHLQGGGIDQMAAAIQDGNWPALAARARRLVQLFHVAATGSAGLIDRATRLRVALQPCIRDIWHDHLLFTGDRVSGIVDFGSMKPDNVATDVARLLGSLVGDERSAWELGLAAYESIRPLSDDERSLINVFDRTTVLMGGLQWLEWIYLERKAFSDRTVIETRLDQTIERAERLAQ